MGRRVVYVSFTSLPCTFHVVLFWRSQYILVLFSFCEMLHMNSMNNKYVHTYTQSMVIGLTIRVSSVYAFVVAVHACWASLNLFYNFPSYQASAALAALGLGSTMHTDAVLVVRVNASVFTLRSMRV